MAKFTPLRERVLVAKTSQNAQEIRKIKREIVDAYKTSGRKLVAAAKRLGVNQMTLRRVAAELDIESEIGINRSRGAPVLLFSRARVAVETRDTATIEALKRQILDATEATGPGGGSEAAARLGVSYWSLKKTIDVLGMSGEVQRRFPGKYSLLGERVLVAQQSKNVEELRRIKLEVLEEFQRVDGDIDAAADALGVTSVTLRKLAASLGLSKALGIGDQKNDPVLLLSRIRVASEAGDERATAAIKAEIYAAIAAESGSMKEAAARLGVGTWALRRAIAELGAADEVLEKFPGKGKDRPLTVRVDGRDVTDTIAGWSRARGLNRTTIVERLRRGKSPEEAVSTNDLRRR